MAFECVLLFCSWSQRRGRRSRGCFRLTPCSSRGPLRRTFFATRGWRASSRWRWTASAAPSSATDRRAAARRTPSLGLQDWWAEHNSPKVAIWIPLCPRKCILSSDARKCEGNTLKTKFTLANPDTAYFSEACCWKLSGSGLVTVGRSDREARYKSRELSLTGLSLAWVNLPLFTVHTNLSYNLTEDNVTQDNLT